MQTHSNQNNYMLILNLCGWKHDLSFVHIEFLWEQSALNSKQAVRMGCKTHKIRCCTLMLLWFWTIAISSKVQSNTCNCFHLCCIVMLALKRCICQRMLCYKQSLFHATFYKTKYLYLDFSMAFDSIPHQPTEYRSWIWNLWRSTRMNKTIGIKFGYEYFLAQILHEWFRQAISCMRRSRVQEWRLSASRVQDWAERARVTKLDFFSNS